MNLFVWNNLRNRERLSFALRRPYLQPFEPGILEGYMKGQTWPDILFKVAGIGSNADFLIDGDVVDGIAVADLVKLDSWHATEDRLHKRTLETIKVMRDGKIEEIKAIVYVAGASFSKLKIGARLI